MGLLVLHPAETKLSLRKLLSITLACHVFGVVVFAIFTAGNVVCTFDAPSALRGPQSLAFYMGLGHTLIGFPILFGTTALLHRIEWIGLGILPVHALLAGLLWVIGYWFSPWQEGFITLRQLSHHDRHFLSGVTVLLGAYALPSSILLWFAFLKSYKSVFEPYRSILLGIATLAFFAPFGSMVNYHRATCNYMQGSPLHTAVGSQDDIQIVSKLLASGSSLVAMDWNDNTALHIAAKRSNLEAVNLLVSAGANVQARENDGYTPLHFAARRADHEVVRALLEANANVNALTDEGYSPLHFAVDRGWWLDYEPWDAERKEAERLQILLIVRLLVDAGADVSARSHLGETPMSIALEHELALEIWRPLARKGVAPAQYILGLMYIDGLGVQQDYAVAAEWFHKAAEQGHTDAQYNLGWLYEHGYGVAQDYTEAVNWYRRAAEQDQIWSQENLGYLYYNGQGIPQDFVSAYMWWSIAFANGDEDARSKRDKAAKKMTPADISEAQRRARVCIKSRYQDCDG